MKLTRREFLHWAGAIGLSYGTCALAETPSGPRFSIAAINDLHITNAESANLLKRAVGQINALANVKFTAVLGDITQDCEREAFERAKHALDRLKMPYKAIPGNHDVIGKGGLAYSEYNKVFGERSWVHPVQQWYFMGLDTCSRGAVDVQLAPVRMGWITEQLKSIPANRPIALFTHHPFNPHACQYRVQNADKVLALFAGHRLRLVASGHWHGNQVETQNGVLFTTTACCSSVRSNHDFTPSKGFRLFHFSGEQVEIEFVPVEMPRED